jgi:hypothetical protein
MLFTPKAERCVTCQAEIAPNVPRFAQPANPSCWRCADLHQAMCPLCGTGLGKRPSRGSICPGCRQPFKVNAGYAVSEAESLLIAALKLPMQFSRSMNAPKLFRFLTGRDWNLPRHVPNDGTGHGPWISALIESLWIARGRGPDCNREAIAEVAKALMRNGSMEPEGVHSLLCEIGRPDLALRNEMLREELDFYLAEDGQSRLEINCGPCASPAFRAAVSGRTWTPAEALSERPLPCSGPAGPRADCHCSYQPVVESGLHTSWHLVDWPEIKSHASFSAFQAGCMADFRDRTEEAAERYSAAMLQNRSPDGSLGKMGFPACHNLAALHERTGAHDTAIQMARLAIESAPSEQPFCSLFVAADYRILSRIAAERHQPGEAAKYQTLAMQAEAMARSRCLIPGGIDASPNQGRSATQTQTVIMVR